MQVIDPSHGNITSKILNLRQLWKFNFETFNVFLAGSIANGKAEPWQKELIDYTRAWCDPQPNTDKSIAKDREHELIIFNPRHESFDTTIVPNDHNSIPLKEQIDWEIDGLKLAHLVVFYFDAKTQSPISIGELGLATGMGKKTIVFCPDAFWRSVNVQMLATALGRRNTISVDSFDKLKYELKKAVIDRQNYPFD